MNLKKIFKNSAQNLEENAQISGRNFFNLRFQAGILLKKNFRLELYLNKNFGPTLKKCRPPYPPPQDDMYECLQNTFGHV